MNKWMKAILPILYILVFGFGIQMILKADTGMFGSFYPTLLAGAIICGFSGVYLGLFLTECHKEKGASA